MDRDEPYSPLIERNPGREVATLEWVLKFDNKRGAVISGEPDWCPHCRRFGKQQFIEAAPPVISAYPRNLWLMYICPRKQEDCGLPYFAVYRDSVLQRSDIDWWFSHVTPRNHAKFVRDANVDRISPKFYDIMDQAFAAEEEQLDLVAGPGYRKALEHLVKDYVIATVEAALATSDPTAVEREKEAVRTERRLGRVIGRINDVRLQAISKRGAWLGNDETHYERTWVRHDIEDLKKIIWIVVRYIENELAASEILNAMPEPEISNGEISLGALEFIACLQMEYGKGYGSA